MNKPTNEKIKNAVVTAHLLRDAINKKLEVNKKKENS